VLEARGLPNRAGAFLALDCVDFEVRRGGILGYLGSGRVQAPYRPEERHLYTHSGLSIVNVLRTTGDTHPSKIAISLFERIANRPASRFV
jgi:hypothetical protein